MNPNLCALSDLLLKNQSDPFTEGNGGNEEAP
jgi:hypothetical protein